MADRGAYATGTTGAAALSVDGDVGHSNYGRARSRQRSRCRRHRHTSSGSESRSSSSTRRKCSKWSLKRYMVSGKDVKKLNCYELITASIRWCLDIEGLTVADFRAFLAHLNFMSSRARNDDFKDSAHVDYDKDIRKLAEIDGFAAFDPKNTGLSIFHYGTQNMRPKKNKNDNSLGW